MKTFQINDRVRVIHSFNDSSIGTVIEVGNEGGNDYLKVRYDNGYNGVKIPPKWCVRLKRKVQQRHVWLLKSEIKKQIELNSGREYILPYAPHPDCAHQWIEFVEVKK